MNKIHLLLPAVAGVLAVSSPACAQYATSVISYSPGIGFAPGFTNSSAALGAPASGGSVTPFAPPSSKSQIVSIGTNGSITLRLGTPVVNNPSNPFGIDFIIFGNSFFSITNGNFSGGGITSGALGGNNTGATRVDVSADGVHWFTLNPSLAPTVDGLFPTDGFGDPHIAVNPALTTNAFAGLSLSGIRTLYNGSAGGTGFDLAWSQDTNGNSVNLPIARYLRVSVLSGKSEVDAVSAARGSATCIAEDFVANPLQSGWGAFGDTNLFQWDSTNQNLRVMWDSSQSNSFFYHPLGTILARDDDFSLAFDLRLDDIGPGIDPIKTNSFELAIGFLHLGEATRTNLLRGTGSDSPDLVEFDYFWDSGYGATVWPAFVDTNSSFNYNSSADYSVFGLAPGDWYHVVMNYTASNQTLVTTLTNSEQPSGVAITQPLNGFFTDYRVDTIAISSYSDAGQDPEFGEGSILAHGAVDNFVVTVPPQPIQNLSGAFSNSVWQVHFSSRSNWVYTLERTTNFQSWAAASPSVSGNGINLSLSDTNTISGNAFYRVKAERP